MNIKSMSIEGLNAEKERIEAFWAGIQGNHIPFEIKGKFAPEEPKQQVEPPSREEITAVVVQTIALLRKPN